jgi:hypothetical protein
MAFVHYLYTQIKFSSLLDVLWIRKFTKNFGQISNNYLLHNINIINFNFMNKIKI